MVLGLGVTLGSDSNPGRKLVRLAGVLIDFRAIINTKMPAAKAVIKIVVYEDIFFITR